ncbi:MAG: hypothetical protein N3G21_06215 [Candidatus Hydrogenedentes bacterium]|nr:hypothetical protein [Candidatus Hydrogenedentota bacterium]
MDKNRLVLMICFSAVIGSVLWGEEFDLLYDAEAGSGHQYKSLNLANRVGTITIDTDQMVIYGPITPTRYGEDVYGVCVFRFSYVNLGSGVNVVIQGKKPLAILSNGDMVVNTNIIVPPGSLGGAFGGEGGKGGKGGYRGFGMGAQGGFGGNGGAGGLGYYPTSNGQTGTPGQKGDDSNPGYWEGEFIPEGQPGSSGISGENGKCFVMPNTLMLAGGSGGGGGGGGGGRGGSGDGGGGGGGGSGGGGGGGFILTISNKSGEGGGVGLSVGGNGGDGGQGGNGGTGALGGKGGDNYPLNEKEVVDLFVKDYGEDGGDGGKGGTGGGALVLGAKGLLTIGPGVVIDISAGLPMNGSPGTGGGGGGRGGYGTPGMVKLQGSLLYFPITPQRPVIRADNSGSLFFEHNGRVTFVTNMSQNILGSSLPNFTNPGTLIGLTTNDSVLRDFNPFYPQLDTPLIPQLESGVGIEGYLLEETLFENKISSATSELVVKNVSLIRLSGQNSFFEGFDQIVLINGNEIGLSRVYIKVGNNDPVPIANGTGDLSPGQRWTTLIPSATPKIQVELIVLDILPGEEGEVEGSLEGLLEGEEGFVEGDGNIEGTIEEGEGTIYEGEIQEGSLEGGVYEGEGEPICTYHSADYNKNWKIELQELLRVIQFFNSYGYHCQSGTEDGYAPGIGSTNCKPHDSDFYQGVSWNIELQELLRLIQFFNFPGSSYHCDGNTEDGFAPGTI